MRAIHICVQRGKLIIERVTDKTLCRQMVTLIGLHVLNHLVHARITLDGCGVELNLAADPAQPWHAVFGVLDRDASNHPVDLIPLQQQELSQVGAILAGNPRDQGSFFAHSRLLLSGRPALPRLYLEPPRNSLITRRDALQDVLASCSVSAPAP